MEFYIDEAGNTGRVAINKGKFNYGRDRYLTVCAIKVNNSKIKEELSLKYENFKQRWKDRWNIKNEIKGTDLCIKKNNDMLNDFIDNLVLNNKYFYFSLIDKKYLVALDIVQLILPWYIKDVNFYILQHLVAEIIVEENDSFFETYFSLIEFPTIENIKMYINYLIDYNFKITNSQDFLHISLFKMMCETIKKNKGYDLIKSDITPFIEENGIKYYFVANFQALYSVIEPSFSSKQKTIIYIIHDDIEEFRSYIKNKILNLNKIIESKKYYNVEINLKFEDSEKSNLIQFSDNISSIINKFLKLTLENYNSNGIPVKKEWPFDLLNKILINMPIENMNTFVPIKQKVLIATIKDFYNKKENKNFSKEEFKLIYEENYDFEFKNLSKLTNHYFDLLGL